MAATMPGAEQFKIPTFQEYLQGRPVTERRVTAPYAHPMDRAIIEQLSRSSLQHAVNRFVELVMHYVFTPLLFNSIPVASKSFPVLNDLRAEAAGTLGIPVPDMYAAQLQFGAIFTAGTDEESFIFIDTTYAHVARREEMLFVVGHECGHIDNHHVTYRMLAALLLEAGVQTALLGRVPWLRAMAEMLEMFAGPALAAWSRRSEITADRAGLICCRDLKTAQMGLVRLMLGFASESEINVEDYLQTMRETPLPGTAARWSLLDTAHPIIPIRLQALQMFHDSEIYYEITGLPRPDRPLMPRDELEGRVGELVAIL